MEAERSEHRFSWWRQGVLLFDEDYDWSSGLGECAEAEWTGAWLGQSRSGGVTYVSPGGAMFGSTDARLTAEVLDRAPRRRAKAESIGDFDLRGLASTLERLRRGRRRGPCL